MNAEIAAELDQFREGLFTAFNAGDYQNMLEKYCHKEVIATWQDGTTSKGYDQVLAQFNKLLTFIQKMKVQPTTDMRVVLLDGKLAISSGNMLDTYDLIRGSKGAQGNTIAVALQSRWNATLIKENGKWLLTSFCASANAFNNQVVDLYLRRAKLQAGAIAGAVGLLLGLIIGLLVR